MFYSSISQAAGLSRCRWGILLLALRAFPAAYSTRGKPSAATRTLKRSATETSMQGLSLRDPLVLGAAALALCSGGVAYYSCGASGPALRRSSARGASTWSRPAASSTAPSSISPNSRRRRRPVPPLDLIIYRYEIAGVDLRVRSRCDRAKKLRRHPRPAASTFPAPSATTPTSPETASSSPKTGPACATQPSLSQCAGQQKIRPARPCRDDDSF